MGVLLASPFERLPPVGGRCRAATKRGQGVTEGDGEGAPAPLRGAAAAAAEGPSNRRSAKKVQRRRPPPAADTGRSCWGSGQQDTSAAQGTKWTLGTATRLSEAASIFPLRLLLWDYQGRAAPFSLRGGWSPEAGRGESKHPSLPLAQRSVPSGASLTERHSSSALRIASFTTAYANPRRCSAATTRSRRPAASLFL